MRAIRSALLLAAAFGWSIHIRAADDDFSTAVNDAIRRGAPSAVASELIPAPGVQTDGLAAEISARLAETIRNLKNGPNAGRVAAPLATPLQNDAVTAAQNAGVDDQEILLRPANRTVLQIKGRALERAVRGQSLVAGANRNEHTARHFLRRQKALLRLQDPDAELRLLSEETDHLGQRLRFSQSYRGLPVWPAGLRVHLDADGNVNLVDGAYVPTPAQVNPDPRISADEAMMHAKTSLQNAAKAESGPAQLIIYAPLERAPRLAWRFDISIELIEAWRFVVDALNGRILHRSTLIHDANVVASGVDLTGVTRTLNVWEQAGTYYLADTSKTMFDPAYHPLQDPHGVITILDARGMSIDQVWQNPVFRITSTAQNSWDIPAGVSAAFNFSETYDYFLDRHGRNSLDAQGGNVRAIVRVGGYGNASWHGNLRVMLFGDVMPFAASLDVIGHELGHGVTENSAGLIYENQSGALNEAFSDIFGEMVEARTRGQNDWLMGSEIGQPIRNMKNPGALTIPGLGRSYPSKMSEFVTLPNTPQSDHGGVHMNSSIINHAFYLLAEGLDNPLGRVDAARIFYRALTAHLQAQSQFIDCRLACIAAAEQIFGAGSTQARRTAAAFDAVEVFAAPTTPEPTPVPVVQGPDSTLFVYFDLAENAYSLGRRETARGDNEFGSAFASDIHWTRPAVSGDGTIALFVDSNWDICVAETANRNNRICLGYPGLVHSVALSPDSGLASFVLRNPETGKPDGKIRVINIAAGTSKTYNLVAPSQDGVSIDAVLHADAMTFSTDGTTLIYDALSRVTIGNGAALERWSIYSLNLSTEKTSIIVPPIEGFNTGNPSFGRAGNRYLAFDAISPQSGNTGVLVLDLFTGQAALVAIVESGIGFPAFTGDESAVIYAARDAGAPTTGFSLFKQALAPDRLTKEGQPTLWYRDAELGVIYRRGTFNGTNALPTVTLTASPMNPAPPATITLNATANDSDGQVAKVEFYNGTQKLGEVTAAPFQFIWQNVPQGNYRFIARAIDNVNGAKDSASVAVVVGSQGGTRSHVEARLLANGSIRLTIQGEPGDYIISQSGDLKDWADIYPVTVGPNGIGSIDDSGGPQNMPVLFYRARKSQ